MAGKMNHVYWNTLTTKNNNNKKNGCDSELIYLYISQALKNTERNGPNLRYMVSWRREDTEDEWNNITTTKTKHIIHNTDTYVPYEIKIQAINEFGHSSESSIVIGYSGEDSEY